MSLRSDLNVGLVTLDIALPVDTASTLLCVVVVQVAMVGADVGAVLGDVLAVGLNVGLVTLDIALPVTGLSLLRVVLAQVALIGTNIRSVLGDVLAVRLNVGLVAARDVGPGCPSWQ